MVFACFSVASISVVRVLGAPVGVIENGRGALARELHVGVNGGSERRAGVRRGRLHEQALDERQVEKLAVAGAVEGGAAGEAEIGQAGAPVELLRRTRDSGLETELGARRDVLVVAVDRIVVPPPRPDSRDLLVEAFEVVGGPATVAREIDARKDSFLWVAVGGETHYLSLVVVRAKAESAGEALVEDPPAVLAVDVLEHLDRRASADAVEAGFLAAAGIERDDIGLLERRQVEGRGGMGEMVTHPHQLAAGRGAEPAGQLGDVGLVQAEVAVLLAETPIDVFSLQSACGNRSGRRVEYGLRIAESNRDYVHVVQPATGVLETPLDRPDRRCVGSVLDPVETLFLDHRDELSVHEDGRRVVEPVGGP